MSIKVCKKCKRELDKTLINDKVVIYCGKCFSIPKAENESLSSKERQDFKTLLISREEDFPF